jgi:iron complex outermembrane recepter protein
VTPRIWALAAILPIAAGPTLAAASPTFDIPAGPLGDALVALGSQAGITVGLTDTQLARWPSRAVRGRMSVAAALNRLVAGLPVRVVRIDAQTFQIQRHVPAIAPRHRPTHPPAPDRSASEIIVTGSKRAAPMRYYPGSIAEIDTSRMRPDRMVHGSEALVDALPVLASTHLGPGRNKLFIRGIADSSFNGPSQSTVGQYLGDVRLNYSAPDPDLALYDIHAIEVLEGPQGTLYGAGALGGVIRLVPNAPDPDGASLSVSGGGSAMAHGAPGWDASAIGNLPLVPGRIALRATVYGARDGGYIDDVLRGRHDINDTLTRGGRATLRVLPGAGWTIDLGGVVQDIDSADGQYAERGLPPLDRASRIAQPFDNDYALASLVVRKRLGSTDLVSATSAVFHEVGSTYDATGASSVPLRYHEDHHIQLLTNETRLSHQGKDGAGWVLGMELLRSADRLNRTLGPVGSEGDISGTSNIVEQASLFGEATIRLLPRWYATGGLRISHARLVGDVLDLAPGEDDDHHRHATYLLPSAGLLWKVGGAVSLYARYQEGVRPGGLSVQLATTQRFEADSLATWELGMRIGDAARPLSGGIALSYAHWEDVQADLVDSQGLPYTANIGSGRVLGAEARASWKPSSRLSVDAAIFANSSRLDHPEPAFAGETDASLPNIADLSGHLGIGYMLRIAGRPVDLSGALTYVGGSRLGVGTMLDLRQGRYFDTALGASTRIGHATVSLDASNLLDAKRNIFALGNPFGLAQGSQITPLRPRTIRLGFQTGF